MLQTAAAAGLDGREARELSTAIFREVDPADARLVVARKLLARSGNQPRSSLLATAGALAREVLAERRGDPEASWVLGAAIALERLATGDPALVTRYTDWEGPLLQAVSRGGQMAEDARRVLAAAYLATWPYLSEAKRGYAERLLRAAFEDRPVFDRLFESWVQIAGGIEAALRLLPDRSWAWQAARTRAARDGHQRLWVELEERELEALARERRAALAQARTAAAAGQTTRARQLLDPLWSELPVELGQVPELAEILAARPVGPASPAAAEQAARWLELDRDLETLELPGLPDSPRRSLFAVARPRLSAALEAELHLRLGDRPQAERIARRHERLWSEEWGRYLLLQARVEAERGSLEAARETFARLHPQVLGSIPAALLAARLGVTESSPSLGKSWVGPPRERRGNVLFEIWVASGSARLELLPRAPVERPGFQARLWNGRRLPWLEIQAGSAPIELLPSLGKGAHLLELAEGPENVRRGTLRLQPLPGARGGL